MNTPNLWHIPVVKLGETDTKRVLCIRPNCPNSKEFIVLENQHKWPLSEPNYQWVWDGGFRTLVDKERLRVYQSGFCSHYCRLMFKKEEPVKSQFLNKRLR